MRLGKMLKLEDAIELASLLHDNGYSDAGITIVINLKSDELLNKVNEDFYFKNNNENKQGEIEHVDEIVLNINGITFKYIAENEERSL